MSYCKLLQGLKHFGRRRLSSVYTTCEYTHRKVSTYPQKKYVGQQKNVSSQYTLQARLLSNSYYNRKIDNDISKNDNTVGPDRHQNVMLLEDSFGQLSSEFKEKDSKNKLHQYPNRKIKQVFKRDGKISNKPSKLNEEDFIARAQNLKPDWSDTFGTLTTVENSSWKGEKEAEEKSQILEEHKPHIRLSPFGRKNTPYWYAKKIERLGKEGKVQEAIQVLEAEMLKEDRVLPSVHAYSALIGILGRVGYTKKAFQIFNQMKKLGLAPDAAVYTGLFNACANSPWKEDGLQRTRKLRELMREKEVILNFINYKALMKAYAFHGEMQSAFSVLDEATREGHRLDTEAFCFLLMACISDKEAGFKHTIEVWREMRRYKLIPDKYMYNLLLRAVRDCGIGSQEFASTLVGTKLSKDSRPDKKVRLNANFQNEENVIQVQATEILDAHSKSSKDGLDFINVQLENINQESFVQQTTSRDNEDDVVYEKSNYDNVEWWEKEDIANKTKNLQDVKRKDTEKCTLMTTLDKVPNILNPKGKWRHVVGLADIKSTSDRLMLLGGADGILSHMSHDKAQPDVITLSLLLEVIPSQTEDEEALIEMAAIHNVKLDADFFNAVIRKRNLRFDFTGARELLVMMTERNLSPNIRTFGCLAMGCRREDGLQLIEDIDNAGLIPNVEIFNILMYRSQMDFVFKNELLKLMKKYMVLPDETTLKRIDKQICYAKKLLIEGERTGNVPTYFKSKFFKIGFRDFMLYYKMWLQQMEFDSPNHPWSQYRQAVEKTSD